jgi:hypothetical protein
MMLMTRSVYWQKSVRPLEATPGPRLPQRSKRRKGATTQRRIVSTSVHRSQFYWPTIADAQIATHHQDRMTRDERFLPTINLRIPLPIDGEDPVHAHTLHKLVQRELGLAIVLGTAIFRLIQPWCRRWRGRVGGESDRIGGMGFGILTQRMLRVSVGPNAGGKADGKCLKDQIPTY